jgi:subtilisin
MYDQAASCHVFLYVFYIEEQTMKRLTRLSSLLTLLCVLAAALGASPIQAAPPGGAYIIVFHDSVDVPSTVPALVQAHGLQPGFTYQHALKGMSAVIPAGRLAALQNDPRVAYVVEDLERSISAQAIPTGIQRIFAPSNGGIDIDGTDDYRVDVDVAVIDTGIDFQHPDLNVWGGVNCVATNPFKPAVCKDGGDDDHYHGTHVAGTIAAIDNGAGVVGVAPGARLWAVKVLNSQGSGYSSWIIAGIDWVAANAATIEVANMSLGGSGYNTAEYTAIQGAVNAGVAFAVAAGNNDADASSYSPAAFNNVLTVSALADFNGLSGGGAAPTCRTDQDDTLADFSNWGPKVDIAAPGVCILSTYPIERGSYGTISGTSMASPHVAGALALLASRNNPNNATDVNNLYNLVKNAGNFNWTDDSGDGIKEPLLDVSDADIFNPALVPGSGGGGTNQPPSAGFTFTISGLIATFTDTSTDPDGSIAYWSWTFGDEATSADQNPSHAYTTAGTYTVNLTVTDDKGATSSASQSVTVQDGSAQTITVSSLSGSSASINKNFWKATVTATVSPALPGAVVSGNWTGGSTASCTTDDAGKCQVTLNVSTKTSSTAFTVSSVSLAGYTYTPGVTSVTVNKP